MSLLVYNIRQLFTMRINFHRVIILTSILASVISYAFLWVRMITTPVEYTGSDFITYYTVGVIANRHGLDRVYDFELQKAVEEEIVGFEVADSNVMPHNHIPLLNPLLALLVWAVKERYLLGMGVWALLLTLVYIPTLRMLLRIRPDQLDLNLVNMLACLLFFPLFVSLMNGQDTFLLVLGAVLLLGGVTKRQDWISGLGLALMTVRPQIALMMALPFLLTNSRVWWRFCALAALFVIVSVAPLGRNGLLDFFDIMSSAVVGSRDTAMYNLIGLMSRAFPGVPTGTVQAIGWAAYGLGVVGVCILWKKSPTVDGRLISIALILSLLVSPHLVYHDLTLLIVPLVTAAWIAVEATVVQRKEVASIILAISLLLLLSYITSFTQYLAIYLLMGLLLAYHGWPGRINRWKLSFRKTTN